MRLWIVTVADAPPHETLLRSALLTDNEVHVMYVKHFMQSHGQKITQLRKFAQQHLGDSFLFVDAFDTLLVAPRQELEAAATELLSTCDVMFSAETVCWMGAQEARWKSLLKSSKRFQFLNSGVILARCQSFVDLLGDVRDDVILSEGHWSRGTDQAFCAKVFLDWLESSNRRVRVELDTDCRLALSHTQVNERELDWSSWRPRLGLAFPLVIHFNGRSYEKPKHDDSFNGKCFYEHGVNPAAHLQGRFLSPHAALSCDLRYEYVERLERNFQSQCKS